MDERTKKLINTYKTSGPLSSGAIKDVFDTTPTTIASPTPAPTPQSPVTLPQPKADKIQEAYITSLSENQATTRKTLEDTYKSQKDAIDKEKETLEIKQQGYLSNIDPTTRPTYDQETRIMQNQLDASESASKTLQTNFEENQKLVGELEKLLTEGNTLIEQQRRTPGALLSGATIATNKTIQDVSARTGVINAVLSARDGQIAQAHNIINQGRDAVKAQWDDQKAYYNTLLDYNDKKIISLDEDSKAIAEKQVGLIENDLKQVDETVNYLKEQMVDPKTAQFMAEAGVTLTDSIKTINTKMAKQAKVVEIREKSNELSEKGYTQVPMGTVGAVPLNVGGTTLYFKKTGKGIDDKDTNDTRDEYVLAEEFVNANPEATDEEIKSSLLRDSNLSVTDINAILANRPNKVTVSEEDATDIAIQAIENSFEKKFFSSRTGELKSTKDFVKKNLEAVLDALGHKDMNENDKERILQAIEGITVDDIEV